MHKNYLNFVIFVCIYSITISLSFSHDKLIVASFNPIATDFAKKIGGNLVAVIAVMKPGDDPHKFQPKPEDLKRTSKAKILLFMGKGLETFLPKTIDIFGKEQIILEIGKMIPSLVISENNDLFFCCPTHSKGSIDPHWWHSIKNSIKAIRIINKKFCEIDPKNKDKYNTNYKKYKKDLEVLYSWAKKEISKIPRKKRVLSTSHAAFAYFCKEFGFKGIPIQGLNKEHNPKPIYLKEVINIIKNKKIKAAFPEKLANPKVLKTLIKETGIKMGKPLIAGSPASYEKMIKNNINSITEALGEE